MCAISTVLPSPFTCSGYWKNRKRFGFGARLMPQKPVRSSAASVRNQKAMLTSFDGAL